MKIRKGQNHIYRFFDPDLRDTYVFSGLFSLIGKTLPSLRFPGSFDLNYGGVGYYVVPDNMVRL